jgi:hypothetical protein
MRRLLALVAVVAWAVAPPAAEANEFRFTRTTNATSTLVFSAEGALSEPLRLRAGSGTVPDECAVNFGWLPRGVYDVQSHEVGLEGSIGGYAWSLSDAQCYDGTFRTQLLIHSEMSADGGQDDSWEPHVWTWSDPDDYASFGCIKISYPDMLVLEEAYQRAEAAASPVFLVVE